MTTTGGKTWDAAFLLCDYLESEWAIVSAAMASEDILTSPSIIELGSGTGWLGMTVCRNVAATADGETICLTEQAGGGALEWLEENLTQNIAAGKPLQAIKCQALDWSQWHASEPSSSSASQIIDPPLGNETRSWNLLIGSDLIYDEVGVTLLPKVIRDFATQNPKLLILYSHTLHRFDHFDLDFCEALRNEGLEYQAIAAHGASTLAQVGNDADPLADERAGFLEEMFPEKRVVIFQIFLKGAAHQLPWSGCLVEPAEDISPNVLVQTPSKDSDSTETSSDCVTVGRIRVLLPPPEGSDDFRADVDDDRFVLVRLRSCGPFGSGQHPTTAVMLQELQQRNLDNCAVCDYGCGSGVLGLTALALGARRSVGIDIIPDALDAAQLNIQANGSIAGPLPGTATARLALFLPSVAVLDKDLDFYARYGDWRNPAATRGWTPLPDDEDAGFELVIANIVVGPLCNSAAAVRRLVKPGGEVLLSGFRESGQMDQVKQAYGPYFELSFAGSVQGWGLLRGKLHC